MSLTRRLLHFSLILIFILGLIPCTGLYPTASVQAATYALVKSPGNPVVGSGISSSNGTVIFDSSVPQQYKMWYIQTTPDDTIRNYLFSLLSPSFPSLINDLKAGDFNAVAASDSNDIKAVLTALAGLDTGDLTNYLNSISTTLKYATSTDGIVWSVPADATFTTTTIWDQFITSSNVIKDGSTYKMWYTGYTIDAAKLGDLFDALDAANLTPANISILLRHIIAGEIGLLRDDVIGLSLQSEITGILNASLAFLDSSKPAIGYAISADGITWTKDAGNPVMETNTAVAWESCGVMTPSVIKNTSNPNYEMWYTGINININLANLLGATSINAIETALLSGVNVAIGHATSPDGKVWTKNASPVLQKGIPTDWDGYCVFAPSVIKNADGSYDMWYTGGKGSLNTFFNYLNRSMSLNDLFLTGINTAIGHATSINGTTWVKDTASNPVLSKGAGSAWDNYGVAFPAVVANAGYVHLWYTGVTGSPAAALSSFLDGGDLTAIVAAGGISIKIGYARAPIPPPPSDGGGGGGGGGAPPLTGITKVVDDVMPTGQFIYNVVAWSADMKCFVAIPKDTIGLTSGGASLREISIIPMTPQPTLSADATGIGLFYELGPSGATFKPPITISLSYMGLTLPAGINEKDIVIAWRDAEGKWNRLESTVDTIYKVVTAKISHFTPFGLMISSTGTTDFTTTKLTISPSEVQVSQPATISILVTNTSSFIRSFNVELKIDNVVANTKAVTLAGGASETVTFTLIKNQTGTYNVAIGTESGKLYVKEVQTSTTTTPPLKPAAFTTSDLEITPLRMKPGDTATVSVTVTNTGNRQGMYKVTLKVNGVAEDARDITLAGGTSQVVNFTLTKSQAGTYAVSIDTLSASLIVQTPVTTPPTTTPPETKQKAGNWPLIVGGIIGGLLGLFLAFLVMQYLRGPAAFHASGLSITPPVVKPGVSASVVVKLTNTGKRKGTYKVVLKVNNTDESSQEITLAKGESQTVSFTVTKTNPGIYLISVDNASGRLVVQEIIDIKSQTGKIRPQNWPGFYH